jgi:hypothetical protein
MILVMNLMIQPKGSCFRLQYSLDSMCDYHILPTTLSWLWWQTWWFRQMVVASYDNTLWIAVQSVKNSMIQIAVQSVKNLMIPLNSSCFRLRCSLNKHVWFYWIGITSDYNILLIACGKEKRAFIKSNQQVSWFIQCTFLFFVLSTWNLLSFDFFVYLNESSLRY